MNHSYHISSTEQPAKLGAPESDLRTLEIAGRLLKIVKSAKGKHRATVEELITQIGREEAQPIGRMTYNELSIGYLSGGAGVSRPTAAKAWATVFAVVPAFQVLSRQAADSGAELRPLTGGRRGRNMLLPEASMGAAREVVRVLGLLSRWNGSEGPQRPTWHHIEATAPTVRAVAIRCPHHDDKHPSATLWPGVSGGAGYCHVCTDGEGSKLRLKWRPAKGGGVLVSKANSKAKAHRHAPPPKAQPPETLTLIDGGAAPVYRRSTLYAHHVRATIGGQRPKLRKSTASDVYGIMRRADTAAVKAADRVLSEWAAGVEPPDELVSQNFKRAIAWREISTKTGKKAAIPRKWEAMETKHVLSDLDDFGHGPIGDSEALAACAKLERYTRRLSDVEGFSMVRTSQGGIQILWRLSEVHGSLWQTFGEGRDLVRRLDTKALRELRAAGFEGGHADQAVHTAGGNCRLPGWRMKNGVPYLSRLVYVYDGSA